MENTKFADLSILCKGDDRDKASKTRGYIKRSLISSVV